MLLMEKKKYNRPVIEKIELDNSISLVMMTTIPDNPIPRGDGSKGSDPFSSPFDDKTFG